MNFDLYKRTIYLTVYGSQVYGFATPESDWDYRGICIPPLDAYIGLKPKFEQIVDKNAYKHFPVGLLNDDPRVVKDRDPPDMQIMDLVKFARLAADGNPSVLEILFTDPKYHIIKNPIMDRLLNNKELFLSQKTKYTFHGYAFAQLKRINIHKKWLDNPPKNCPKRKDFDLPEQKINLNDELGAAYAIINKNLNELELDEDLSKETKHDIKEYIGETVASIWSLLKDEEQWPVGKDKPFQSVEDVLFWEKAIEQEFPKNLLELLAREKKYRAAKNEWDSYQNWKKNRNPKRAAIEAKHHYDCKNAVHLYRLLCMAIEILDKGEVIVTRPDAKELLEIRNGKYTYEQLMEVVEEKSEKIEELFKKTTLPKKPNQDKIHDIVHEMVMEFNGKA